MGATYSRGDAYYYETENGDEHGPFSTIDEADDAWRKYQVHMLEQRKAKVFNFRIYVYRNYEHELPYTAWVMGPLFKVHGDFPGLYQEFPHGEGKTREEAITELRKKIRDHLEKALATGYLEQAEICIDMNKKEPA